MRDLVFFLVLIGPSIVVVFLMGIFQSIRCTRRIVCTLALLTAYLSICVIAPTLMFEWIRLDEGSAPLIAPLLDSSLFVLGFRGLEIAAFRLDRFVVGLWKEWGGDGQLKSNVGQSVKSGDMAVIAAFDFGIQMAMNGLNIRCISWSSVVISGTLGAAGAVGFNAAMAGALKRVGGFKNGMRANGAFPRGIEYLERSRFWPGRWRGPHSWWNQNLVPGTIHALTDPKRWRFMKSAFKKEWTNVYNFMNKTSFGAVLSSLAFRVPWWFEGALAGGATGATVTSTKCGCE